MPWKCASPTRIRPSRSLNQTVIAQWKQIDALRRQLGEVLDRVQEVEDNAGGSAPDRPPPHY